MDASHVRVFFDRWHKEAMLHHPDLKARIKGKHVLPRSRHE
jgi:hypothetical protein